MCSYPSCTLCSLSSPTDPNMAFDMMKGMFTNMLPMIVIGGWINWTFSGFITSEFPWQHNHLFDFSLLPHNVLPLQPLLTLPSLPPFPPLPPSLLVYPHMYLHIFTTFFLLPFLPLNISWTFSLIPPPTLLHIYTAKVPFPLTLRFKGMLQRGIELKTLSASWYDHLKCLKYPMHTCTYIALSPGSSQENHFSVEEPVAEAILEAVLTYKSA